MTVISNLISTIAMAYEAFRAMVAAAIREYELRSPNEEDGQ